METETEKPTPEPWPVVINEQPSEPSPPPLLLLRIPTRPDQPNDPIGWAKYVLPTPAHGDAIKGHIGLTMSAPIESFDMNDAIGFANTACFESAARVAGRLYKANPQNQPMAILLALIYDHDPTAFNASGLEDVPGVYKTPSPRIVEETRAFLFGKAIVSGKNSRPHLHGGILYEGVFGDLIAAVWLFKVENKTNEAIRIMGHSLMRYPHPSTALTLFSDPEHQFCWPLLKYAAVWGNTSARVYYARALRDYALIIESGEAAVSTVARPMIEHLNMEAINCLASAARRGSQQAWIKLGEWTMQGCCALQTSATQNLRYAAMLVNATAFPMAKAVIGSALLKGNGVLQNIELGRDWLRAASKTEICPSAALALADSYYYPITNSDGRGQVHSIDIKRAAQLYFDVASIIVPGQSRMIVADACRKLASLIFRGAFPMLGAGHAVTYLLKGCSLGDPVCGVLVAHCVEQGMVDQVPIDRRQECASVLLANACATIQAAQMGEIDRKHTAEGSKAWAARWFTIATTKPLALDFTAGTQFAINATPHVPIELACIKDPLNAIPLKNGMMYVPREPSFDDTIPVPDGNSDPADVTTSTTTAMDVTQ